MQTPIAHICVALHAIPQPPQFDRSLSTETHAPPQSAKPAGHAHIEAMHRWPPPQTTPQAPQLAESRDRSRQLPPPQSVKGGAQPRTHDPAWQRGALLGQALPHAPQFRASLSSDRQVPSQKTVPAGHAHDPEMHAWPPPQAWSQLPQWFGSVAVSTHASAQLVCPGAEQPQTPFRHACSDPHRFPQLPQLAESVRRSAHVAPHVASPDPQGVGVSGLAS
jgi:hypothetical protein